MKRVAESQLTKDNVEEEDSQEPTTGIQKADSTTLSARRIRSLPKRGLSAAPPTTSVTALLESSNGTTRKSPEPASRFSGFQGFGSSTPSAFTFTPPASHANTNVPPPPETTSVSSGKSFQLTSSSQPFKVSSFVVPTSNPTPPSTPPSIPGARTKRDTANNYFLSLRGLNTSFLDAITQAVQADPFVDISELLEKYKSLRPSIQKTFDDGASSLESDKTSTVVSAMAPSLSESTHSMPTPPHSFFGLGNNTRAATSQLHASGFTPKLDHAENESSSSSFTRANKARTSEKPISFGTERSPSESTSSSGIETSAMLATPLGSTASESILAKDHMGSTDFTPDKSSHEHDIIKGKDISSSLFNFKPSAPAVPLTPGFSSFLGSSKSSDYLGESSTSQLHSKSTTSNPSPPSPSAFGFGTGKGSSTSNPFSFGKGSIGNPVGFAFGSPPIAPGELKPPDTSDISQDTGLKGGSEATDGALLSSHDPSPAPSQGSAYDADGPGEEDEVTLHEIKAHAYKMVTTGDAKNWVSVGKGQLKLKGRDDIKRRLLMRNSSTGHILLNFNLFPGFQAKVDGKKKVISFSVPGEDKTATLYQLRVPNEAEAVSWQEAIQKEVDGLLSPHDT